MRLIHDNPQAMQQPRHTRVPELFDYDGILPKPKKVEVAVAKYVSKHARVVDRVHSNRMGVRAGRVFLDAERNKEVESVSPWNDDYPMVKAAPKPNLKYSVSPWNQDFPHKYIPRVEKTLLLPSEEGPQMETYSPFDSHFPKSTMFNRKRLTRNRGQRKRRQLVLAMSQYKKEHGPANLRTWEVVAPKIDPNMVSYSPWQEEQFAKVCKIPASQYFKSAIYRKMKKDAEMKKFERLQGMHSVSPFDKDFPNSVAEVKSKRASVTKLVEEYKRASVSGAAFSMPVAPVYQTAPNTARASVKDNSNVAALVSARASFKDTNGPRASIKDMSGPRASLKAAVDARNQLNIVTPRASIKGVQALPVAPEVPKVKSPNARVKAAAFPAISPMHKKHNHKKPVQQLSIEEQVVAPYLNRFLMGAL